MYPQRKTNRWVQYGCGPGCTLNSHNGKRYPPNSPPMAGGRGNQKGNLSDGLLPCSSVHFGSDSQTCSTKTQPKKNQNNTGQPNSSSPLAGENAFGGTVLWGFHVNLLAKGSPSHSIPGLHRARSHPNSKPPLIEEAPLGGPVFGTFFPM